VSPEIKFTNNSVGLSHRCYLSLPGSWRLILLSLDNQHCSTHS